MTRSPDSLEKDESTISKLQLANKAILQKYYKNIIKIFKHYQNMALPSETKGRQNQYHEDQKYVDLMHHYSVLCRSTNKRKLIRNSYESLPHMKNFAQRTSAPRRLPASPAILHCCKIQQKCLWDTLIWTKQTLSIFLGTKHILEY